ncbi:MAG: type II secretion system F family protein [Planctomycetes bacterium]|nr:type II secretion system F family protein [Planctomycetota bacterium]
MAVFEFEGLDKSRKKTKATVEARNEQEAVVALRKRGIQLIKPLKQMGSQAPELPSAGKSDAKASSSKPRFTFSSVSRKQLTQFTVQFSILQDAGLPIVKSLKILEGMMKPSYFKTVLEQVWRDVESGSTLSDAMIKHPKAFDKLYVNLVKAGESGGVLDTILQRLAKFMEKSQKLRRKVISAMIYPIVVIVVAVSILMIIMSVVVPKFLEVFKNMGQGNLPAPTQLLLAVSGIMQSYWYVLPVIVAGIIVGVKFAVRNYRVRLIVDNLKMQIPIFGVIIRKSTISRLCRTLGTMIQSGVQILEALTIVKNTVGNEIISNAVQSIHSEVREGGNIADTLAKLKTKVFDDIVINMINVGEETGELDKMLIKIADNYDDEVDTAVGTLMSVLEPLIIVVLGGVVAFIVISLFLPLVTILTNLGK